MHGHDPDASVWRSRGDGGAVTARDGRAPAAHRWVAQPTKGLVNAPWRLVVAILAVWGACSAAYALLEDKGFVESLWWGVVTGSTVGYGDQYPATTAGRVVAVVLIVSALVLVPIAIGHVIAGFVVDRNAFTHDEQVALADTVGGLHERVELLEHLLLASLGEQHGRDWVARQVAEWRALDEASHDRHEQMLDTFRDHER